MFLNKLSEVPKSVWIVTIVTVNVQPTYSMLNTIAADFRSEEEAQAALSKWQEQYCIVFQEINEVHLDTDPEYIRTEALRALKGQKTQILAERQKELDEVDEAIQNLLALPAPNEGDIYDG